MLVTDFIRPFVSRNLLRFLRKLNFVKLNGRSDVNPRFRLICGGAAITLLNFRRITHCKQRGEIDNPLLISSQCIDLETRSSSRYGLIYHVFSLALNTCFCVLKVLLRVYYLTLLFAPFAITYPLTQLSRRANDLWWLCLILSLQRSGPTIVKFCQWASTRRDLFSKDFCDTLAFLHTKTTSLRWKISKKALDEFFHGKFWKNFLTVEEDPIGSGSIAQVYKGKIDLVKLKSSTHIDLTPKFDDRYVDVAIKVANQNVRELIEVDLSILRFLARVCSLISPTLKCIDLISCLNQFELVLKRQADLNNEAKSLERFANNFNVQENRVIFPKVLLHSEDVIIETFEDGMYANRLVTGSDQIPDNQIGKVKKNVAQLGAHLLLKMIFVDNFVHGDLHPGNILIRLEKNYVEDENYESILDRFLVALKNKLNISGPRISFCERDYSTLDPLLVILDTGIVIEETKKNLNNLKSLFRGVIEGRGKDVGNLLLSQAPQQWCTEPEKFCTEVNDLIQHALSIQSLSKFNISELLNQLFAIVSKHHVRLETSFTTVVIAVMVLEGFGRSLDPDLNLLDCARPFILSGIH